MKETRRQEGFWPWAVLLVLGFAVYSNTFSSPFHFDDNYSIVDNPSIRHLGHLRAIWDFWPTRFMTYLSFALNYHFHALNVFGYHALNLAIHLGSAVLVWRLGLLIFLTPAMRGQKITQHAAFISFFAGLIFVSHPVATQAVTYIVQRAASLATFFYLASLCLYVRSRLWQEKKSNGRSRLFCYAGSLVMGAAAMFTKEMAITLPLMAGLIEFSLFTGEKKFRWKPLIPFLLILLIIPLIMVATRSVNIGEMRRAGEPFSNISSWQYFLTQFGVVATYLRLLLAPLNQTIDYDYPVARSFFSFSVLGGLFLWAGLIAVAAKLFRGYRLAAFGLFWFFLTLLPESSVIPIRDVIFEHRLYLPMAGFSLFLSSVIYYIFEKKNKKTMFAVSFLIVACFSVLTYVRNAVWKSDLALWDDAVRKAPHKARPYNNRGLAYADKAETDKALSDFSSAIGIDSDFAEAYNNRGSIYLGKNEYELAFADYNRAIEKGPRYAEAYHNRGLVYANQGSLDRALEDYKKALEINPAYAEAYYDRGNAYYRKGNFDLALSDYSRALAIKPYYAEAYNNRGSAYYAKGDVDRAVMDYDTALSLKPDYAEARNNRALIKK